MDLGRPGRSITAAALISLASCKGIEVSLPDLAGRGRALSYAQYQSLQRGLRAGEIRRAFGEPEDTLSRNGRIRGMTYRCEDSRGEVQMLRMVFTPEERLDRWTLGGPGGRTGTDEGATGSREGADRPLRRTPPREEPSSREDLLEPGYGAD